MCLYYLSVMCESSLYENVHELSSECTSFSYFTGEYHDVTYNDSFKMLWHIWTFMTQMYS